MIKIYHNYQNVAYHKLIMYLIIVVEVFDKKIKLIYLQKHLHLHVI